MRDITLCHPRLQELAAELIEECSKQDLRIKIGETYRTVAEQNELYAQGRTKPGNIVTNAPGTSYSSMHQWGIAFDFFRNDGQGAFNESGRFFERVGAIGVGLGLEWGGNWKSIKDRPHFQLPDWGSASSTLKRQYGTPEKFMKTWPTNVPEKKEGWILDNIGYWYQEKDGTYPKNAWKLVNRHWYLFNADGYMLTGWARWNGTEANAADGSGDWYFLDNTAGGPYTGACWHSRENGAQEIWTVEEQEN